jgi:hypothetical protein
MVRHIQYVVRPFNLQTCEYGPVQTVTDPPCDPACTITGPGLYLVTRQLDTSTCTFSETVCVKVGPCPSVDCP